MKKIILCSILLITPLLIGGGVYVAQSSNDYREVPVRDEQWQELKDKISFQIKHFPGVTGVYIKDLTNGQVIEYNQDRLFPSASLVKIPVMVALYDAQSKGRISLDEVLSLESRLRARGSGKLRFQKTGSRFTIRQLIYKMITESDNTATNMLTDFLGLDYFNSNFLKLGLTHTNFSRMIMDLKKRDRGIENYTTPQDMAHVLELIYSKELTGSDEMVAILKGQKINDRLAVSIPSDWEIGHKTGLMRDGCHDVGIVYSPNGSYVICVLTADFRNIRRAKNLIREISFLTANYYQRSPIQTRKERRAVLYKASRQSSPATSAKSSL